MVQSLKKVPGEEGFGMLSYWAAHFAQQKFPFVKNPQKLLHSVTAPLSQAGRRDGKLLHMTDQQLCVLEERNGSSQLWTVNIAQSDLFLIPNSSHAPN